VRRPGVTRRSLGVLAPSPRSQTGNVERLKVRRDFSVVRLPVAVQVPVRGVDHVHEVGSRDHLALGVESRVEFVTGGGGDGLARLRSRVEAEGAAGVDDVNVAIREDLAAGYGVHPLKVKTRAGLNEATTSRERRCLDSGHVPREAFGRPDLIDLGFLDEERPGVDDMRLRRRGRDRQKKKGNR